MYTTCYGLLTPSTGCLHSYFYSSIVVNIRNYSVLRRDLDKSKVNLILFYALPAPTAVRSSFFLIDYGT